MHALFDSLVALITETSTNLPPDVRAAMKRAQQAEIDGSRASQSLAIIAENIDQACEVQGAICLLYTSPSPRDRTRSRMPSSA